MKSEHQIAIRSWIGTENVLTMRRTSFWGHVWIGMGCLILKGAYIPEDCIVAAKSVVCSMKNVNKGSLLGGIPARILKENINWNHKRIK